MYRTRASFTVDEELHYVAAPSESAVCRQLDSTKHRFFLNSSARDIAGLVTCPTCESC